MNREKLNIGLFGLGCVGQGFYNILQQTTNINAQITAICVKNKNKNRSVPKELICFDKEKIFKNNEINTIVELIDDSKESFEIVKLALQNGKAVVTANKKMIAENIVELITLQKKHNKPVLYEAACCAGIPIIRSLEEYYNNDLLERLEGIVNGSSNYILNQTIDCNLTFSEALKDAQVKGFAESDPTLDIGGFDAKYKLQILLLHGFGVITTHDNIYNLGIENISAEEVNYAKEKNVKIKLIAFAEKKQDKIQAYVMPKFVSKEEILGNVNGVLNGVKTRSFFSDSQFFIGKGAGANATASAVISDISALGYNYKYEYRKLEQSKNTVFENDFEITTYIKYPKKLEKEIKTKFHKIIEVYENSNYSYLTGSTYLSHIKHLNACFSKQICTICI